MLLALALLIQFPLAQAESPQEVSPRAVSGPLDGGQEMRAWGEQEPPGCATASDCATGFACSSKGVCEPARPATPEYRGWRGRAWTGAVPEGFHLVSEPQWGSVVGGVAAFVGGYGLCAGIGLAAGRPPGAIPFAGPVILAGQALFAPTGDWAFVAVVLDIVIIAAAAIDLAAQVGGVVLIITGSAPKQRLERDEKPSVTLVPSAPGAPLGASVVGRF